MMFTSGAISDAMDYLETVETWTESHPKEWHGFIRAASLLTKGGARHSLRSVMRRARQGGLDIPEGLGAGLLATFTALYPVSGQLIYPHDHLLDLLLNES